PQGVPPYDVDHVSQAHVPPPAGQESRHPETEHLAEHERRKGREKERNDVGGKREIESQRQGAHVGSRRDADSGEHETHAAVLDDQTAQEHARRSPPGAGVGEECRSGDRRTWYLHLSDLLRADLLRADLFRADLLRANHLVSRTRAASMKATDVPRAVEPAA